jgi:hypothetical protein
MRVGQTKRGSLLESLVNIAVGAGVAFWSQVIVFHFMGIPVRYGQNLIITAIFTVISIVRSFILRRIFNWWTEHHQAETMAQRVQRVMSQPTYGCTLKASLYRPDGSRT